MQLREIDVGTSKVLEMVCLLYTYYEFSSMAYVMISKFDTNFKIKDELLWLKSEGGQSSGQSHLCCSALISSRGRGAPPRSPPPGRKHTPPHPPAPGGVGNRQGSSVPLWALPLTENSLKPKVTPPSQRKLISTDWLNWDYKGLELKCDDILHNSLCKILERFEVEKVPLIYYWKQIRAIKWHYQKCIMSRPLPLVELFFIRGLKE